MTSPGLAGARDAVFVSYSHDDQEWRRKFTQMLAPMVRNQRLVLWDDTFIPAGDDWRRGIEDGVRRAGVALLLVSDSYLASRFIMDEELPALVAQGVRLVAMLVRDCMWDQEPQLARVQWAHDPGREGPLAAADPREVPGRVVQICHKLLEFAPAAGLAPEAGGPVLVGVPPEGAAVLAPGPTGRLHEVPTLPSQYLERPELGRVRAALLEVGAEAVGLTGDVRALGLHGQGGIGKTVLAAAVAQDRAIRAHFPDGVFWVTAGETPDLAGLQTSLLARLGVAGAAPRSATEGMGLLRQALAGRQVLLVVDDVWSSGAAEAFRVAGPRGRVLYTTRDPMVLAAVHAAAEQVGVLSPAAARQLLARIVGVPEAALPDQEVARVLAATGQVALAVALVGAAVRGGASWPQVAGELDRGTDAFLDHPYANTFKALQVATAALDPGLAFAYTSLAVYPPDVQIPVAAIARYWGQLRDRSPGQVRTDLQALADRQLLILDRDEIAFHDLQHSYLLLQTDNLALLHADLLATYQGLLPASGTGWWWLPPGEPYIWDHLLHHLHGAGDRADAASTLTDLAYVAMRIALAGPHAAETDLAHGSAVLPDDPRIGSLRRWLAQHTHVLTGLTEPGDVAATLAAWLAEPLPGVYRQRLDPLLPTPYLVPRWGLPTRTPALDRVLAGHTGPVIAVAFSPDGRQLATGSDDGSVRLWDPATGAPQAPLAGHTNRVIAVAFSPDGRQLATGSDDGSVRLWDPATGAAQASLPGHIHRVTAVAFSPDGRQLATGSWDGTVRLWDRATGAARPPLPGHTDRVTAVAFSPDGRQLATGSDDGSVRLWDPVTGAARPPLAGHIRRVTAVAFSPDGRQLATGSDNGSVRLWDPVTGAAQASLPGHIHRVTAVAFSPDGRQLATGSWDGTVRLWDPVTGAAQVPLPGHTSAVTAVAFSPDGRQLATGSWDGTVRLWDPVTGAAQVPLPGHTSAVTAVAFSLDGRQLATGSDDGSVRLWDPVTGAARPPLPGHTDRVTAVAFSLDGRQLATGSDDGSVRLWDPVTGAARPPLRGHTGAVTAVAFSPDGEQLATGSWDGTVRLADPVTGTAQTILPGHPRGVTAVAFSPDGRQLATGSWDGFVRLWDPVTGAARPSLPGHTGAVTAVAFSPDGRQLATGSDDGSVRLWDPVTGAARPSLPGHTGAVTAVAFSPDGGQLATSSTDRTVRLSDVNAAERISLLRLDAPIQGLAWSCDAIVLAKGSSVTLFDVMTH